MASELRKLDKHAVSSKQLGIKGI